MDEPTVGLDPKTAHVIYEHLRDLVAREGRTVLMVDQNVIAGTAVAARYRATIAEWLI